MKLDNDLKKIEDKLHDIYNEEIKIIQETKKLKQKYDNLQEDKECLELMYLRMRNKIMDVNDGNKI